MKKLLLELGLDPNFYECPSELGTYIPLISMGFWLFRHFKKWALGALKNISLYLP